MESKFEEKKREVATVQQKQEHISTTKLQTV